MGTCSIGSSGQKKTSGETHCRLCRYFFWWEIDVAEVRAAAARFRRADVDDVPPGVNKWILTPPPTPCSTDHCGRRHWQHCQLACRRVFPCVCVCKLELERPLRSLRPLRTLRTFGKSHRKRAVAKNDLFPSPSPNPISQFLCVYVCVYKFVAIHIGSFSLNNRCNNRLLSRIIR